MCGYTDFLYRVHVYMANWLKSFTNLKTIYVLIQNWQILSSKTLGGSSKEAVKNVKFKIIDLIEDAKSNINQQSEDVSQTLKKQKSLKMTL